MNTLAIHGGEPSIKFSFKKFNTINEKEIDAVTKILKKGTLSAYIGAKGQDFMGGPSVQALEKHAAEYFKVKHAIAVNSWTSGLIAAVGAIGLEPGDEVITSPWTMSATACAILHYNGIPVFADIEPNLYCLDPVKVKNKITKRTKAILCVDIFGQSSDIFELKKLCKEHNLKLICDTAQAPGAFNGNEYTGTLADIGGFSLNYHKHIHCGEGGILVTNDDELAKRLCLIRNHAESVIDEDEKNINNLVGFNFRMGEIEAAIASIQLEKLEGIVRQRQEAAQLLYEGLKNLKGLHLPELRKNCTHVYYVFGMYIDKTIIKHKVQIIVDALKAEGVPALMKGYQNIHLLPLFKNKIAFGNQHFPWNIHVEHETLSYQQGLCPVAENLHQNTFFGILLCMFEFDKTEVNAIVKAFHKVWSNLEQL